MQNREAIRTEPAFKAAIAINPRVLHSHEGKSAEALALFQEATANDPQYSKVRVNWGLVLASQRNFLEAQKHFEEAVKTNSNDADALKALAILRSSINNEQ